MAKAVQNKDNTNCIYTPAQCVEWTYGSIEYLGICNGDMLPEIIWEIVNKLKEIAGQDLSSFDIDTLLDICNAKAPLEKNIITILELLRHNQICLKDYIDTLNQRISELSNSQNVKVNLKCLADFDNFGNQLGITRETLDQLVVDELCNHDNRITTVEGKVTSLQNQINNIDLSPIVNEPEFATCVDAAVKPTSSQTISIANKVCSIENYLGKSTDASIARSNFGFQDSRYQLILGWILSGQRENILDDYNNLLLVVKDLETRVIDIQDTCCAPTCDKIKIGFSVIEDTTPDYLVRFRPTDGNNLFGFSNNNSTVTFTGKDKITKETITTGPLYIDISNEDGTSNSYPLATWFDTSNPITVNLKASAINGFLICEKCISQIIDLSSGCPVCEITASGDKGQSGSVKIVYEYNLVINSITLQSGYSAFIPKGAKVISIFSETGVTILPNECVNLNFEPLQCYSFRYVVSENDINDNPAWENGNCSGVSINNLFYSTSIAIEDPTAIGEFLASSSNGAIEFVQATSDTAPNTKVERKDIIVRTSPSIIAGTYIKLVPEENDGDAGSDIRIYAIAKDCPNT